MLRNELVTLQGARNGKAKYFGIFSAVKRRQISDIPDAQMETPTFDQKLNCFGDAGDSFSI